VQEILRDGAGQVTGVRAQQGGVQFEENARIVVGADGRNSILARVLMPEEYNYHEGKACGYYSFFTGDFDLSTSMLALRGGHGLFLFPTNDNAVCLAFEGPSERFEEIRADPLAYMQRLYDAHWPDVASKLRNSTQTERWFGLSKRPSFYRKPYGPGWALVGDAGFLKDPILGDGINDSFRDAELLARAIDAGLSGREPLDQALRAYEEERNRVTSERYTLSLELTEFGEPTPEQLMRVGQSSGALAQAAAG
jgi:2-polyprenyl-6-methoxyphenol hydroxylase-like FAD-dependent oxidoreductase